jgi:chorismate mutase/prephenate dehydratase
MSLDQLRYKIDEIDNDIVALIAQRQKIAEGIGQAKMAQGLPVTDPAREKLVIEKVKNRAVQAGINPEAIAEIYLELIKLAKTVEGSSVAYLGEPGTFSEEAAFRFFGPATKGTGCDSFEAIFRLVERGEARYGVVPIDNSLEGSIVQVYDLLLSSPLKVCGETMLRVSQNLIANPATELGQIKRVYSHPQALGQSRAFLKHLGAELIATSITAGSVKMLKETQVMDAAAVASFRAAQYYGMKILAAEIEDNANNFTRFFVLGHEDALPSGDDKTSVVFSVKHRPGSLSDSLREFAMRDINLTKIESRPTRKMAWEYNFYLDFEGHRDDKKCQEALAALEEKSIFVKVLGSYPKAKEKE